MTIERGKLKINIIQIKVKISFQEVAVDKSEHVLACVTVRFNSPVAVTAKLTFLNNVITIET